MRGAADQPALNAGPGLPAAQPQGDLSKIVRDGRIAIVVARRGLRRPRSRRVSRIATSLGGFVLTSTTRDQSTGTFTLRIPAKKFDVAMERLRGIGEVKADAVTGQDVTAEFIDQTARLQILLDRRDAARRASRPRPRRRSEILRLAALIEQTQLEIEQIQGQLRYLKDQVAEATIKVDAPRAARSRGGDRSPPTDNPSLSRAIRLGWQGFLRVIGAVIVGLGYLVPDRRDRARDLGDRHAGAASPSRSQLSARNRSAAVEATAASSPSRPSVAPNHASASIHAASISSSGRSRPFGAERVDRAVPRDRRRRGRALGELLAVRRHLREVPERPEQHAERLLAPQRVVDRRLGPGARRRLEAAGARSRSARR